MYLVKKAQTNKFIASASTTISEYIIPDPNISGAVADINGRYPETGFAKNIKSKELVYVLSGKGSLLLKNHSKQEFQTGDVLFIDKNEEFAWLGNFKIFMATTPKFIPEQHVITDNS